MHRSGTSALTRILNLCGAALPENLLPANAANESGYWEPAALVRFHDQLLLDAMTSWDDPLAFSDDWFDTGAGRDRAAKLAEIVVAEYGASPLFVVKDPRVCRLVPLWRRALSGIAEVRVVLIVRHPREVAASLGTRDGLAEPVALLLWLRHVLAAESTTRDCRRVVVTYGQVLDDWTSVVARIESGLGISLPAPHGPATAAAGNIAAFLQPSLRHARVADEAVEGASPLMRAVRTTWEWHVAAAEGRSPDPAALDGVRDELASAEALMGPQLRRQVLALRESADTIRQRDARLSELEGVVAAGGERISGLEAALVAGEARLAAVEAERLALQLRLQTAETHLAATQSAAEHTRHELETRLADLDRRACELHETMIAMQRSPFWKARTWIRRQQARLSGGS